MSPFFAWHLSAVDIEAEEEAVIEVLVASLSSHPGPFAPIDEVEEDAAAVVSNITVVVALVGNPVLDLNGRQPLDMVERGVAEVLELVHVAEFLAAPVAISTVGDCAAAVAVFVLIPLVAVQLGAESTLLEASGGISGVVLEKGHYMRVISFLKDQLEPLLQENM